MCSALKCLTSSVLVRAGDGNQEEALREACTWSYWATFSCFQARNMFAELSIDHRYFAMLNDKAMTKNGSKNIIDENLTAHHLMLFTVLRELLVTMMLAEIFSP